MLLASSTYQAKDKTLEIRCARQADATQILNLKHELLKQGVHDPLTVEEYLVSIDQERELIKQTTASPDHLVIVAEIEGNIVGTLYFHRYQEMRCCHAGEFGLGLKSEYRGLKIGQRLLEKLLDWAKEQPDLHKVCLKVFDVNTEAIKLYEKMGFEQEGCLKNCLKMADGQFANALLMAKFV